jgi:hypothetical protein
MRAGVISTEAFRREIDCDRSSTRWAQSDGQRVEAYQQSVKGLADFLKVKSASLHITSSCTT